LAEVQALHWHWPFWARADQLPPDSDWTSWLMLGGRGGGKTRAGAEWVRTHVETPVAKGGAFTGGQLTLDLFSFSLPVPT